MRFKRFLGGERSRAERIQHPTIGSPHKVTIAIVFRPKAALLGVINKFDQLLLVGHRLSFLNTERTQQTIDVTEYTG